MNPTIVLMVVSPPGPSRFAGNKKGQFPGKKRTTAGPERSLLSRVAQPHALRARGARSALLRYHDGQPGRRPPLLLPSGREKNAKETTHIKPPY